MLADLYSESPSSFCSPSRQFTLSLLENHHPQPGPHLLKTAAHTTEEISFLSLESNHPGYGQVCPDAAVFPALPHLGAADLPYCH